MEELTQITLRDLPPAESKAFPEWLNSVDHYFTESETLQQRFLIIKLKSYLEPNNTRDYSYLAGDLNQLTRKGCTVVLLSVSNQPILSGKQLQDFSIKFIDSTTLKSFDDAQSCLARSSI
jgi:hypothetical protein